MGVVTDHQLWDHWYVGERLLHFLDHTDQLVSSSYYVPNYSCSPFQERERERGVIYNINFIYLAYFS